jgi:hypothetical protein
MEPPAKTCQVVPLENKMLLRIFILTKGDNDVFGATAPVRNLVFNTLTKMESMDLYRLTAIQYMVMNGLKYPFNLRYIKYG